MGEEWDDLRPISVFTQLLSSGVLSRREEKYISLIRIQLELLWQRLLAFK